MRYTRKSGRYPSWNENPSVHEIQNCVALINLVELDVVLLLAIFGCCVRATAMDCCRLSVASAPVTIASRGRTSCGDFDIFNASRSGVLSTRLCWKRKKRRQGSGVIWHTFRATRSLPSSQNRESPWESSYREPLRLLQSKDEGSKTQSLNPIPSTNGASTSNRSWTSSDPSITSEAIYTIQLTTSKDEKSGLSIWNAGIILSLIGEQGEAIVQRLLPVKDMEGNSQGSSGLRFQRGSVDVITIRGPDLGRLAALWIAPEAGTWRLAQATVTTVPCHEEINETITVSKLNRNSTEVSKKGLFHVFKGIERLLGDGEELPAIELKPFEILECDGPNDPALDTLQTLAEPPKTAQESAKVRENSMKEYEALKIFLLGSSVALVAAGTLGFTLIGSSDMAQGFAAGGVAGTVYLLLLQRAVDGIPSPEIGLDSQFIDAPPEPQELAPEGPKKPGSQGDIQSDASNSKKSNQESVLRASLEKSRGIKVKTPAASFALFVGLALVVTRATQAGVVLTLPPQELLAGALGFFTTKIAVFLAAFSSPSGKGK